MESKTASKSEKKTTAKARKKSKVLSFGLAHPALTLWCVRRKMLTRKRPRWITLAMLQTMARSKFAIRFVCVISNRSQSLRLITATRFAVLKRYFEIPEKDRHDKRPLPQELAADIRLEWHDAKNPISAFTSILLGLGC